jgi:hypothetical protein
VAAFFAFSCRILHETMPGTVAVSGRRAATEKMSDKSKQWS